MVFPGFQLLDVAGLQDAFSEVKVISKGEVSYELITIGTTREAIHSSSGLGVTPNRTIFDPCPFLDTVIVPGGVGVFNTLDDEILSNWLSQQFRSARRIAAICNGAFLFGVAGLLDGRTVTTHWADANNLADMFPKTKVLPDNIYIKDEQVYTTAGVTAGIDLSLVLIEEDFGFQMALDVAKYLVVYVRRAGGQSQYSPLLDAQGNADSKCQKIQQFMLADLVTDHTVISLGKQFNMSPRNLSRIFHKEYGIGPIEYLTNARIEASRALLEIGQSSVGMIARRCGFKNVEAFRRAFFGRLGVSPLDYRERFRSRSDTTIN